MSRPTNLSLGRWFSYRGGTGYLLWALHRATGVGVLLFLALHIVDIFLLGFGPELFNELLFLYKAPWARVGEVFLLFGVTFHALNGLRIIVQDFSPRLWAHQRRLVVLEIVVFVIIFLPAAWIMITAFLGNE
ncbi:MAG: succinate dehydrogenase, cytochrome b556 subunit [Gemmatimonadota bacterium]|nr:MAG: succinate dehydrogenase, cytochrome b556 subunit [Gemmatimonadota bacterium]